MFRKVNRKSINSTEDDFGVNEKTPLMQSSQEEDQKNKEEKLEQLNYPDYTGFNLKEKHAENELKLKNVIQQSAFLNVPDRTQAIVNAFNKDNKESWVVPTLQIGYSSLGERIPPGKFLLLGRNNKAELVLPINQPVRIKNYFSDGTVQKHGYVSQTDVLIGVSGHYLVNVPQGKIAKAWRGMNKEPVLLGEGSHVIHDANFSLAINPGQQPTDSFVSITNPYIQHGNYHILRVPQGKVGKIFLNGQAVLLPSRPEPYVFNDNTFKLKNANPDAFDQNFQDVNELYIHHGNVHIIRVPQGFVAKIKINGEAKLLKENPNPYVFNDPTFQLAFSDDLSKNYQSVSDVYIQHGRHHILRVRQGTMGKIYLNNEAILLPAKKEPYVFEDPTFKLAGDKEETFLVDVASPYIKHGMTHILNVPKGKIAKIKEKGVPNFIIGDGETRCYDKDLLFEFTPKNADGPITYFHDSDEKLIVHGHLKRILPQSNEVAITYNADKLEIIREYKLIELPTHSFKQFFPTTMQTLVFPSEKTKKEREKITKDPDEINLEKYRTQDGLPLGVCLVVVYTVTNPEITFQQISPDEINRHIEKIVESDMAQIMQLHKSTDFLNTNLRTTHKEKEIEPHSPDSPSAPLNLADEINKRLTEHLKALGITLNRLNIDTPKILDKKVSDQVTNLAFSTIENQAKSTAAEQQSSLIIQNADNERLTTESASRIALTKKQAELDQTLKESEIQEAKIKIDIQKKRLEMQGSVDAEFAKAQKQKEIAKAIAEAEVIKSNLQKENELQQVMKELEIQKTKFQIESEKILTQTKTSTDAEIIKALAANKKAEAELERVQIESKIELTREKTNLEVAKLKNEALQLTQMLALEKEKMMAEILQNPGYLQLKMAQVLAESLSSIHTTVVSPDVAAKVFGFGNGVPSPATFWAQNIQDKLPELKEVEPSKKVVANFNSK